MGEIAVKSHQDPRRPYTLLTGATGLLGQYLMRDLLLAGHRIAVLTRSYRRLEATDRIEQIMQRFESELDQPLPRPVIVEGDIHQTDLGLSTADRQFVLQHCGQIIHSAAILKFHGIQDPTVEPWRTNVEGTRHVLDTAAELGIRRFHYISTAYVCGCRTGLIQEDEFERGQDFRNDYERSKFAAERLVRESESRFDAVTVYRPVVIAGDSHSGFTSTYHGLYLYLRLFAMFVPEQDRGPDGRILTPVRVPLDGDEPRNVVPVDWVAAAFCRLFEEPGAAGRTFHLAPEQRLTPRQVIEACYQYFDSHGVRFCGRDTARGPEPDYAARIFDNIAIYQQYETSDPQFDTSNFRQFAGDVPCPPIDAAIIRRYLEFGERDQWGKSRPSIDPAVATPEIVRQLELIGQQRDARLPMPVRILGPGGGDWTVAGGRAGKPVTVSRGCQGPHRLAIVELDRIRLLPTDSGVVAPADGRG